MESTRLRDDISEVTDIVASAGGELVGKTRLQKTVYLLSVMGLCEDRFQFQYKHYGPFSESLASATDIARLFGRITEVQQPSSWGGVFSIYRTEATPRSGSPWTRKHAIEIAKNANAIDLELVATAAYLALEGHPDAWEETVLRKPDKRNRLVQAKQLYAKFLALEPPHKLPAIGRP